jgi:hypothetical protein
MASITTWMRLEPHSRASDMEAGLEMRIHDPLWMLTRQWQFGEFHGEDTGSPVWAVSSGENMPVALYLPGQIDGHTEQDVEEFSPDVPLEYLVERERTPADIVLAANRRLAVEAGQQFLRLLGTQLADKPLTDGYRAALLKTLGMPRLSGGEREKIDSDSLAFLDWMANRAVDGSRLLDAVQKSAPADRAADLGFATNDVQNANTAISAWLNWCEQMIGPVAPARESRSTWNPARMEYSCALAAPIGSADDQVILKAEEYPGGHLDWYSFDAVMGQKLLRDVSVKSSRCEAATIPTSLSFRGMPANRLWEFEDAQVRFGSIQATPTDLARMLLVEFQIEYGNDFFTIPIEMEAGSLYGIDTLRVTNTFGDSIDISPFSDQAWRMFALSTDAVPPSQALSSVLFLPPALDQGLESPPIEEVLLLRDEMANMAWAVEKVVESQCGKPLNRHEAYQARRQRIEENKQPMSAGALVYHLDTWDSNLPDYWIPLVPEQIAPGQSPPQLVCVDPPDNKKSLGRLLSEHDPKSSLRLFDEEVPRMGAQLKRTQQYARWYDGGLVAWVGREKRPGRGEGSSGLRYDVVEAGKAP